MLVTKYKFFILLLIFSSVSCFAQKQFKKSEISSVLNKAADWQISNFKFVDKGSPAYLHDYGIDSWTNAVFYVGLLDWAENSHNNEYLLWLNEIGNKCNWNLPTNFLSNIKYSVYHADEFCMGQFYLGMSQHTGENKMLNATKSRVEYILANPPIQKMSPDNKQKWTWCDALFMAPAVYAQLAAIQNNPNFLDHMHKEFMDTYNSLYSKDDSLFFRDANYFEKKELNGEKIFWGRGNGWVVAGLVQILKNLPKDSEYRPFYENLLREMAAKLVKSQDVNGFWHASLLDPENYPAPESSASALILYSLTYGVNAQILDKSTYLPAIKECWTGLLTLVSHEGKLGYVQPIGANPKKVTKEMTATYGIGAFLLAGSELYKMSNEL